MNPGYDPLTHTSVQWQSPGRVFDPTSGVYYSPNGIARICNPFLILPTLARATYSSNPITGVGLFDELDIFFNVTALTGGVSPTVTFKVSAVGVDLVLYQLYLPAALSAAGSFITTIGKGAVTNFGFGNSIQVDMVLTGGPTSITFSGQIYGK